MSSFGNICQRLLTLTFVRKCPCDVVRTHALALQFLGSRILANLGATSRVMPMTATRAKVRFTDYYVTIG